MNDNIEIYSNVDVLMQIRFISTYPVMNIHQKLVGILSQFSLNFVFLF